MALYGYARVSTSDQDLSLQLDALKNSGCGDAFVFADKISGVKSERPGLDACLGKLQTGDTLLVWRLDRLRQQGLEIKEEDVARLSPLLYKHINILGHYSFALAEFIRRGGLRPLNEPKSEHNTA